MWRSARAVSMRVSRRSFHAGTYHADAAVTSATVTAAAGASHATSAISTSSSLAVGDPRWMHTTERKRRDERPRRQ